MPRRSATGRLAATALLVAALAGCTGDDDAAPDLAPAPGGATAACDGVLERAPERVLDRARGEEQAVGVASWGEPPVVLQCGVDLDTAPTNDPCIDVDGVEWLLDNPDEEDRPAVFVTYGRDPGVRVTVHGDREAAGAALVDLAPAVTPLPVTRRCT